MSAFLELLRTEWRGQRQIALGCLVIGAVSSIVAQHFPFKYAEVLGVAEGLVPMLTVGFLVIVASDLVSQDVRTRRMETLALLPVGPFQLWTAKLAFLAIAGAAMFVAMAVLNVALVAAFGKATMPLRVTDALPGAWLVLAQGSAVVAAVVFFSTLAFRSLVAVVLAAASVFAVWFVWELFRVPNALDLGTALETRSLALFWLSVVFVVAATTTYVRGRLHVSSRRRLVAFGLLMLLIVGGAPAAWAASLAVKHRTLIPGETDIRIDGVLVSPDEKYVALTVAREDDFRTQAVWVVRLTDGELFTWGGASMRAEAWLEGGTLCVERTGVWSILSPGEVAEYSVPEGTLLRTAERAALAPRMFLPWRFPPWGMSSEGGNVFLRETSERIEFDTDSRPLLFRQRGQCLVHRRDGALVRHDLTAGTARVLRESLDGALGTSWTALSPGDRYVMLKPEGTRRRVIDTETGQEMSFEAPVHAQTAWVRGWNDTAYVKFHHGRLGGMGLFDARTGTLTSIPSATGQERIFALSDGTLLVAYGNNVLQMDREGRPLRTLIGAED